jgi:hypothetical protein
MKNLFSVYHGEILIDTNITSFVIPKQGDLVVAGNSLWVCEAVDIIRSEEKEIIRFDVSVTPHTEQ